MLERYNFLSFKIGGPTEGGMLKLPRILRILRRHITKLDFIFGEEIYRYILTMNQQKFRWTRTWRDSENMQPPEMSSWTIWILYWKALQRHIYIYQDLLL